MTPLGGARQGVAVAASPLVLPKFVALVKAATSEASQKRRWSNEEQYDEWYCFIN